MGIGKFEADEVLALWDFIVDLDLWFISWLNIWLIFWLDIGLVS
jgi:hypothetical protein